jgi:putative transcriptional regulator
MAIQTSLVNQIIVAMPSLVNTPFEHAVVYICDDQPEGTVGLIINKPLPPPLKLGFIFEQLHITSNLKEQSELPLLYGGPMQPQRGFVLHPEGTWNSTLSLNQELNITTSRDIIIALAEGTGPHKVLVTLGYTAWQRKQLSKEVIEENAWLVCPFRPELLYEVPFDERWEYAGLSIGVKMKELGINFGHT